MSFPRDFGGVLPWGAGLASGARLLLPKQPTTTRLSTISFPWSITPGNISELLFSVIYLDGAGNEVGRITHDVCEFEFPLLDEQAQAITGAADMLYPSIMMSDGVMTFGLSLQNKNTADNPGSGGSGAWDPGKVYSEHALPWHCTTHPEEQVVLEITKAPAPPTISQVVYRFSNF